MKEGKSWTPPSRPRQPQRSGPSPTPSRAASPLSATSPSRPRPRSASVPTTASRKNGNTEVRKDGSPSPTLESPVPVSVAAEVFAPVASSPPPPGGHEGRGLIELPQNLPDTLDWWTEQYFRFEVTTSVRSQHVQRRDLGLFLSFMEAEEKTLRRRSWSPRLSRAFQTYLTSVLDQKDGRRRWADKTVNRVLAHLKTFGKWVHRIAPFPLGNPMEKLKLQPLGTGLEIERAITPSERRKLLDTADLLLKVGGLSRDRKRYRKTPERPRRAGYRPYRNRAILYALIETGMRRAAVTRLNVDDVDWRRHVVAVLEKGGLVHEYHISQEGLAAIKDYLELERDLDAQKWASPALFLTPTTNPHGDGRLTERVVNTIWNEIAARAEVEGKTPHSARHAMGRHIMERTGNIAAVQRQLGHKNAVYSMQYARITAEEMRRVVDER